MIPAATTRADVAEIEHGLAAVIRYGNLPRVRDRLARQAGVRVEAAGYGLLGRLADDGPRRLTELSDILGIDLSTLSRQVKQLEAQALLARSPDPGDRRATVVRLTPHGRRAVERLRRARCVAIQDLLADWSDEDQRAFGALLGRLAAKLVEMSAR